MTATILVVDDEKNARMNISAYLEKRDYEVKTAANLKEARAILNRDICAH